jgi:hypothetical protein
MGLIYQKRRREESETVGPSSENRSDPARELGTRLRLWLPVFLGGLLQLVQPRVIIREFREVGQGDLRGQDLIVER